MWPTDHKTVVRPATEFHSTLLIIERKPGDIDFTSALEDARWDVVAAAIVSYHHVGLKRVVETFVSAAPQIQNASINRQEETNELTARKRRKGNKTWQDYKFSIFLNFPSQLL